MHPVLYTPNTLTERKGVELNQESEVQEGGKGEKEGRKDWSVLLNAWDLFFYWLYITGRMVKAFFYDPDLYSFCKTNTSNILWPQQIDCS